MNTLALILAVTTTVHVHSQSDCKFSIWKDKQVTHSHQFGTDIGILATVPDADTMTDCVMICTQFTECYLAEVVTYPNGGGSCKLFYYNFPPKYMYEIDSTVRIMTKEYGEDSTALVFNLGECKRNKPTCSFKTTERTNAQGGIVINPALRGPGTSNFGKATKALEVNECSVKCWLEPECRNAVFVTAAATATSLSVHGDCFLFGDSFGATSQLARVAKEGVYPILISEISCTTADSYNCEYSTSKDLPRGAKPTPILYYAAKDEADCARVCGNHYDCGEAIWDDRKLRCKLFTRGSLADVEYGPGKGRDKQSIRLHRITCSASSPSKSIIQERKPPALNARPADTGGFRRPTRFRSSGDSRFNFRTN